MSIAQRFFGRGVVPGVAAGQAIVSREPVVWCHGVDPGSGRIVDVRVPIRGQSIRGLIFV
jgi:predicted aconitase with swiveling domain